jgi:cobalt-precorrin 5A hydrolase
MHRAADAPETGGGALSPSSIGADDRVRDRQAGRVALVAITRSGARLAARLASALPGATVFVSPRWRAEAGAAAQPLGADLSALVGRRFAAGESLVMFAAVGVVVRLIAPWLRDKRRDPAVVAVDDAGRYAICVLSGHLGGGNALARRVAALLGAQAVITTATEAHGLPAVDLLGQQWGWRVENLSAVKVVSAALVNGEPAGAVQEAGETDWWPSDAPPLPRYESTAALAAAGVPGIVVTDRLLRETDAAAAGWVVLRPRSLVLGVGASTGVSADDIDALARGAVADAGLAWLSLAAVATLDRKLAEPGLAAFAARHGLPLYGYPPDALARVPVPHPSAIVRRHVGTASVCEAAAVLGADGGRLVVPKRIGARATVAVARRALSPAPNPGAASGEEE